MEKCFSQNGKLVLVHNNHKYRQPIKIKSPDEDRWRCTVKSCAAALYTFGEENAFSRLGGEHEHEALENRKLLRQQVNNAAKLKAVENNVDRPSKLIIQEIIAHNKEAVEAVLTKTDMKGIKNTIGRARQMITCEQEVERLSVEELVREVERHRPLWDSSCVEYASKERRDHHWDEVIARFLPDYRQRSVAERHQIGSVFRKRWKSMRTCFAREVSRQRSSPGCSRRKYLYYDLLKFLDPVTHPLPPKTRASKLGSAKAIRHESSNEQEEEEEEEAEAAPVRTPKRASAMSVKDESHEEEDEAAYKEVEVGSEPQAAVATAPRSDPASADADRMFLMSLADDFQSVPARNKTKLKMEILEAIARAQDPELSCTPSAAASGPFRFAYADPDSSLVNVAVVKMEEASDSDSDSDVPHCGAGSVH